MTVLVESDDPHWPMTVLVERDDPHWPITALVECDDPHCVFQDRASDNIPDDFDITSVGGASYVRVERPVIIEIPIDSLKADKSD